MPPAPFGATYTYHTIRVRLSWRFRALAAFPSARFDRTTAASLPAPSPTAVRASAYSARSPPGPVSTDVAAASVQAASAAIYPFRLPPTRRAWAHTTPSVIRAATAIFPTGSARSTLDTPGGRRPRKPTTVRKGRLGTGISLLHSPHGLLHDALAASVTPSARVSSTAAQERNARQKAFVASIDQETERLQAVVDSEDVPVAAAKQFRTTRTPVSMNRPSSTSSIWPSLSTNGPLSTTESLQDRLESAGVPWSPRGVRVGSQRRESDSARRRAVRSVGASGCGEVRPGLRRHFSDEVLRRRRLPAISRF